MCDEARKTLQVSTRKVNSFKPIQKCFQYCTGVTEKGWRWGCKGFIFLPIKVLLVRGGLT